MKPGRHHRLTHAVAAAGAVVLLATACESDPSVKRVAEDLVNTLATTDAERDCMLEIVDGYSESDLEDMGNEAQDDDDAVRAAAQVELDQLQARLTSCR